MTPDLETDKETTMDANNTKMIDALAAAVLGSVSNEMLLNEAAGRGLTILTDAALLEECIQLGINTPQPTPVILRPTVVSENLTPETVKSYLAGLDAGDLAAALSDVLGSTLAEALGDSQLWSMVDDKKWTAHRYVESLNASDLGELLKYVDGERLVEALGGDEDVWEMIDDKDRVAGDWLESNACDFMDRLDTDSLFDELRNRCR